jgi:DNA-binding transcriptional LysR family regulator
MFDRLFAETGLSLDRLRALVEVGAAGSIVRAAGADPVRQSQYSRQIKELEAFFRTRLVEREGRGTRLTQPGKELARISRFFLLGLANFQKGCLAEEVTLRVGAGATFSRVFLVPSVASSPGKSLRWGLEVLPELDIERRLHDLTLDFGIVSRAALSRPLQTTPLLTWKLEVWAPRALAPGRRSGARPVPGSPKAALASLECWPLALARKELEDVGATDLAAYEAGLSCDSFLEARAALQAGRGLAALLPDFLAPDSRTGAFARVPVPLLEGRAFDFCLAWNPRLLRLNPRAARRLDWLLATLKRAFG